MRVAPGDSFSISPGATNDATEAAYVFLEVSMPTVGDDNLYTFDVGTDWKEVDKNAGTLVYAYVTENSEMKTLDLDESTTPLTDKMTMITISNGTYAQIEDINVSISSYAIGTDGVSTNPDECWAICKAQ